VISGPSGVGKGTLYKMLQEKHPDTFATTISHTTRDPRPGEVRDKDYYYVTMQDFEDLIEKKGFVEHAKFGRNRYGTSRAMIDELSSKGKVVILDIEMEVRCSNPSLCLTRLPNLRADFFPHRVSSKSRPLTSMHALSLLRRPHSRL
jgi:guanylate kinase